MNCAQPTLASVTSNSRVIRHQSMADRFISVTASLTNTHDKRSVLSSGINESM